MLTIAIYVPQQMSVHHAMMDIYSIHKIIFAYYVISRIATIAQDLMYAVTVHQGSQALMATYV